MKHLPAINESDLSVKEAQLLGKLRDRMQPQTDGCRVWTGLFKEGGYPAYASSVFPGEYLVRRMLWRLATGERPQSGQRMVMLCRNPQCVAEAHLVSASATELYKIRFDEPAADANSRCESQCQAVSHSFTRTRVGRSGQQLFAGASVFAAAASMRP